MTERKKPYVPPNQTEEAFWQEAASLADLVKQSPQASEQLPKPVHWFLATDFNKEIWEGAIRIYTEIFANGNPIEKPDFRLLTRLNEPTGGQVVYVPLGDGNIPFEVRSIAHKNKMVMRLKAYRIKGRFSEDGEKFDEEMEKLLREKRVSLLTIGSAI